jgi:regulation of enolase protein 1 (concanavalin A-like superfamily)
MRHPLHYTVFLFVLLAGWNSEQRVSAQASNRPNITVASRLPSLTVNVFPADFNKDGRTDLVGSSDGGFSRAGALEVRYGNGNGTFGDPVRPALPPMVPLGVGDFDNDTRTDILAYHVQRNSTGAVTSEGIVIVPGTASGFGTPVTVDVPVMVGDFLVAAIADFDRDGNRDFVFSGWDDNIYILPGNGDLTFDPARSLPTGWLSRAAVAADLNNDSLTDLAITSEYGRRLDIFLNQGAFTFTASVVPFDRPTLGITAWDVNGDGNRDLLVGSGDFNLSANAWEESFINVMLGNGTGTFASPVRVPSVPGPVAVVAGDFNRDGRVDVASANQSNPYNPQCDGSGSLFATVSILPGLGNGSFGAAATFSLGFDQRNDDRFRSVNALRTNDVNRDGHTDLITAPGAVLLNSAAAANRAPTASAGSDQQNVFSSDLVLLGSGSDPDFDAVSYEWTDEAGRVVGRQPVACIREFYNAPQQTFTLTVTDGRGGVATDRMTAYFYDSSASTPSVWFVRPTEGERVGAGVPYTVRFTASSPVNDVITRVDIDFSTNGGDTWTAITECSALPGSATTCTWRNPNPLTSRAALRATVRDSSGRQGTATTPLFAIVSDASGPNGLPAGWSHNDIGAVGAAGSAAYGNGVFTVRGSGADIWNTADEFHYAWQWAYDDFSITARVLTVQNVNPWTKAGLMIRTSAWSGAPGAQHASIFATPSTVKGLAFQRRPMDNGPSESTAGPALSPSVWLKLTRVGSRVTSYYRKNATDPWTVIAAQTFSYLGPQVAVGLAVSSHLDGAVATATFDNVTIDPLPTFTAVDIGAVGVAGTTRRPDDATTVTLEGSGADIWNAADAFRYYYAPWRGDGTITVRVRSIENTNAWAKAGVMFRESLGPGARHVMAIVSPGRGLAVQYRATTGQASAQAASVPGTAPKWIRLTRSGNTFTASHSSDGITWQSLGSATVAMGQDVYVGLPVTSHNNTTRATALFDDVRITP